MLACGLGCSMAGLGTGTALLQKPLEWENATLDFAHEIQHCKIPSVA